MNRKTLTKQVREGLHLIECEMRAVADTMDDRPDEQRAIRTALDWIRYQEWRVTRQRAEASAALQTMRKLP